MNDDPYLYPNFSTVDIKYKDLFSQHTGKYPSYSDFNLLSLLFWNTDNTSSFSLLNGNLVLRVKDYLGEGNLYSLLGENLVDESVDELLKESASLTFVPEITVNNIRYKERYSIEPDRDNYDYVISTQKLIGLEGREFKHLRRCVHTFTKSFPVFEIKTFSLDDKQAFDQISVLNNSWYKDKDFNNEKRAEEEIKFNNYSRYSAYFNCLNLGLFVDGRLIACILNELLDDGVVMSHIGVSDREIDTSASMMEYLNARYFYDKGFLLQNIQQDTGLAGLRAAKLTYNPVHFLNKYIVKAKE